MKKWTGTDSQIVAVAAAECWLAWASKTINEGGNPCKLSADRESVVARVDTRMDVYGIDKIGKKTIDKIHRMAIRHAMEKIMIYQAKYSALIAHFAKK